MYWYNSSNAMFSHILSLHIVVIINEYFKISSDQNETQTKPVCLFIDFKSNYSTPQRYWRLEHIVHSNYNYFKIGYSAFKGYIFLNVNDHFWVFDGIFTDQNAIYQTFNYFACLYHL
jgi:hypothetical protein